MEPTKIGPYEIIEKIGEGGMGIVYKAVDIESEDVVAIKTLKESVDPSSETFIRFKKEAELLEKLHHPNILQFIDFIEKENRLFIITEFLQGKNLKQIIQDSSLSVDRKADLILQIARALDYVHSQGIIHRDIKPSNIIVMDDLKTAKILDFGVANLMNFQKLFSIQQEGVVGSFAYMSPEQSGILKRNIDTRSDLYSLGILFYQLATGELPYQASEVGELIHQHIAKIPEDPANIDKDLSPIINKIILKLIKKDPDDRYQTSYGLAEDLQTFLSLNEDQKSTFYLELGKKDRLKNLNYRTQLVGRKKEVKRFLEHLNNTILGKGFISVIIGKSGVGKSRLISELQKYTGSKNAFLVSSSSGERTQNHPYYPFIEVVKRILDLIVKLPEQQRKEIYGTIKENLGEEGKILSKIIPEMTSVIGEFEEGMQFSRKENEIFFEKMKDFFLSVASPSHPFILSFDDVHFWDHGSIQLFLYLKNFISSSSLYMILSLREEESLRVKELMEAIKTEAQEGRIEINTLHSLSGDKVEDLVNEIFGTVYSGLHELSARLYESTQGNPLLLIENIKTLVEEGILTQKKEGWTVDLEELSVFRFSSSIIDKILTRILRISSKTKEILSFASVLGKDFTFPILYSIIHQTYPSLTQEELLDRLKEALSNQLIAETLSEKGEVLYSFVHDKIPETLTSHMSDKKIKEIHKVAGDKIESSYEGKDKVYKLAYHFLQADRRNKAYTYNIQAGRMALESYSFKLAVNFFYHALGILKKFAKETSKAIQSRIKLSLEIANINFQLGEYEKNINLMEELAPLAEKAGDKKDLARILYLLAKNYYFSGNQAKAMEYYHKVIPIAETLDIPELLAIPYCAIGRAHCYMANFKESIEYIEKGLKLLPEDEVLEQIYSLGILAQSLAYIGHSERAFAILDELKQKYGSTPNEMFQLYIQFYVASIYSMVGDPKKAIQESQKCREMAREQKNIALEMYSVYFVGLGHFFSGELENAIREITKALRIAEENHISVGLFMVYFNLAEIYATLGNSKIARKTLEKGKEQAGLSNPDLMEQWEKRILALAEISSSIPNLYQAMEWIDRAIEITKKMGEEYRYFTAQNKIIKSMVLLRMEKNEEAEKLFEEGLKTLFQLEIKTYTNQAKLLKARFSEPARTEKRPSDFEITSTRTMTATQTEFSYQRQLKYLLKLSEQLAQVHEMENLLPKIMSLAIEVSGAERGALFLYENADNPDSALILKSRKSIQPEEEKEEMAYSTMILNKTLATGKGQLVMDAEEELSEDQTVMDFKMKSIITVPMITSGKILGAIYLDNRQVKGLFTEENFELLKAFAIEAAISIENAKLYQQVQETARVEQEMEIATDIQTSILPFVQDTEHYEISAFMRTATEVGGDYYDFHLKEKPYFGVFGDVSGHGLKSGLVMMMAEVAFNTLMKDPEMKKKPLPTLYQTINSTLYDNIQGRLSQRSKIGSQYSHMYMTFRLFRFDDAGQFEMFGNDHAEPLICRAKTGEIIPIRSTGFLLGIMEDAMLGNESFSFQLEQGDMLVLYSDGITEAKNASKKETLDRRQKRAMYGEKRLYDLISENRHETPKKLIDLIIESVDDWMSEQEDDITLAVIKMK